MDASGCAMRDGEAIIEGFQLCLTTLPCYTSIENFQPQGLGCETGIFVEWLPSLVC